MNARFTIDGSAELEKTLQNICDEVRKQISALVPADKLEAIFLGGGYGRGEGGVLRMAEWDLPYNDMEFYVCLAGLPRLNERTYGHRLHEIGEALSKTAGMEVEFKIASLAKIKNSPPSMFMYDLAMGHRAIVGNSDVLQLEKFRDPVAIPLHEATRLLMNRCTGLLFAEEKLLHSPFTPEDADFVGRNQAKAQLAFGDVVLTVMGKYHWSCRERGTRLQTLGESNAIPELPGLLEKIICHHQRGVEFKLHPKKMTGTAQEFLPMQADLREIGHQLWLWLEGRRLRIPFAKVEDYVTSAIPKCPETNPLKNRLINLKHSGLRGLLGAKGGRYPRERILHSLPLLLWEPGVRRGKTDLRRIQEDLNTTSTDFRGLVEAYSALWRHFN